jgi:hypothetical protein
MVPNRNISQNDRAAGDIHMLAKRWALVKERLELFRQFVHQSYVAADVKEALIFSRITHHDQIRAFSRRLLQENEMIGRDKQTQKPAGFRRRVSPQVLRSAGTCIHKQR